MVSLAEIYIFSSCADVIAFKTYRHGFKSNTRTVFSQRLKEEKCGQLPPHFVESGVTYYYIKRGGLFFVATSEKDVSPVLIIELLHRLYRVCKDFCGSVSEDTLRTNILLLQELLDEILDTGFVQLTSTDKLRAYVQWEPVVVRPVRSPSEEVAARLLGFESRVASTDAPNRPLTQRHTQEQTTSKSEIFVDVIERLNIVIGSNGMVSRQEISGSVEMKSFLPNNPSIKVAVNEDLTICKPGAPKGYGNQVQLDHCTFHPSVRLDEFDKHRVLVVQPPAGELTLMSYTINGDLPSGVPFQVKTAVAAADKSRDTELRLWINSVFPSNIQAVNVTVKIPVPKHISNVRQLLSGQDHTAQLESTPSQLVWRIRHFPGGTQNSATFRLISDTGQTLEAKELGPVAMGFEISGFTSSGFHIRFLRVYDKKGGYVPYRWVRYITVSNSYVIRLH